MAAEIIDATGWAFYLCDLSFGPAEVRIAGEPRDFARPVITLTVQTKAGDAVASMTADEALLVWKCLGDAIANASGKRPSESEVPAGALVRNYN